MKVVPYIVVLMLSILILSFYFNKDKSRQVTANGPVKSHAEYIIFSLDSNINVATQSISLYYHDSVAHGHPVFLTKNETRVQTNAPAFFFMPNAEQTPYLIYPGEKINLSYTRNQAIEMRIIGNQQRTNELNFFAQLVQRTGNIYYAFTFMPYHQKVSKLNDLAAYEKQIHKIRESRLEFLTAYAKQKAISDTFKEVAVNTIQTTALTDTLLLYFNNRAILDQQHSYQKRIADKVKTITNLHMMPFQVYYKACTMLVSLSLGNPPDYFGKNSVDFIKRFNFISAHFTGLTRDFLMAHILCTAHENAITVDQDYLLKFNSLCTDDGYKKIVNCTFDPENNLKSAIGPDHLLAVDGIRTQGLESLMASHKGKIVLLDFWASWCGPCRAENPAMESLEKLYEKKNIVFVRISTDQKKEDWLRANKEESIFTRNNFLLLNADRSTFVKAHKINTIPRYLLIDKNGKMITDDAPRPSNPRLKVLIDKYL